MTGGSGIVVAGVVSHYMAVGTGGFPLWYTPKATPRWIAESVSGAAGHIARTLRVLGDDARLCTLVGEDAAGAAIRFELARDGLLGPGVVRSPASSLGVVLVAPDGRRMGFPHLAPVDEQPYPFELLAAQAHGADLLVLTNTRFVRPLVAPARELGIPIAVDVHLIAALDDEYNRPWLEAAEVVFCSHERLPCSPRWWVTQLFDRYPRCEVAGVGMGARGALVAGREGWYVRAEAVVPRGVVSTSGAGDALFATFLHTWLATADPARALSLAVLHAGWKIGHHTPSAVSLTPAELDTLATTHPVPLIEGRLSEP